MIVAGVVPIGLLVVKRFTIFCLASNYCQREAEYCQMTIGKRGGVGGVISIEEHWSSHLIRPELLTESYVFVPVSDETWLH